MIFVLKNKLMKGERGSKCNVTLNIIIKLTNTYVDYISFQNSLNNTRNRKSFNFSLLIKPLNQNSTIHSQSQCSV